MALLPPKSSSLALSDRSRTDAKADGLRCCQTVSDEGGIEIQRNGFVLDYLELRHARTLAKVESADDEPLRLLVAARIGQTRLIDNIAV